MQATLNKIPVWHDVDRALFQQEIIPRYQPAILKSVCANWPIVQAGKTSPQVISEYMTRFDRGSEVEAFIAPANQRSVFLSGGHGGI